MTKIALVVAALLLMGLACEAVAAETKKRQSKNAVKVLATLEKIGLKGNEIKNLINVIDDRVEKRQFRIFSQEYENGGRLILRYKLSTNVSTRRFELFYTPSSDSGWTFSAKREAVMINYRYDLSKIKFRW
jgi:hypothetical protein